MHAKINHIIPQGSVLGPMQLILYSIFFQEEILSENTSYILIDKLKIHSYSYSFNHMTVS